MNFSKFDISVLVVMSLAVIIMSYTFPALGMSSQPAVNESDVPEFNISSSTYDITGDFPAEPRLSDSGNLRYEEDGPGSGVNGISFLYLERPKTESTSIEVFNASTGPQITVINWSDTDGDGAGEVDAQTDYSIGSGDEGSTYLHEDYGYVIEFTVTDIQNYNQPNMSITVDYTVQSAPDSSDGISGIPLIGDTADTLATVLSYITTVFAYISLVLVEIVINVVSVSVSLAVYLFGTGVFLATTYADIVASAPSWASVILAVPGLLVSAEFAKLAIVVSKIFPTT